MKTSSYKYKNVKKNIVDSNLTSVKWYPKKTKSFGWKKVLSHKLEIYARFMFLKSNFSIWTNFNT